LQSIQKTLSTRLPIRQPRVAQSTRLDTSVIVTTEVDHLRLQSFPPLSSRCGADEWKEIESLQSWFKRHANAQPKAAIFKGNFFDLTMR